MSTSTSRAHHVLVEGSRTLAGCSLGPASGQPVLFMAGAATSKLMAFGHEQLERRDIRLLTMDRAGIGDSTPDPERTLASTAEDYRRFLAGVLGADHPPVPVVANSQGSVFGLSSASAGWAPRLVLVSPADEIAHPSVHAQLSSEATRLADLAATSPEDAAAVLRGFSPSRMEDMVIAGSSPPDRAFYETPGFRETYRRALQEGFANDGVGYVRDTLLALRPWRLDLEGIQTRVHIMFGAHDRTHSPDLGATLSRRIPTSTREVIADAGGALLWTHADTVLDAALLS